MMSTKLALDKKFTIDSITIESFRGYNKPHSFTFKKPITIFYGQNGNGKSSTLYAIEWCLFGKVEFLSSLEGRSRDEIINQFNHKGIASVKISLRNEDGEVELERTKDTGKATTKFTIKTKNDVFEDDEAETEFFKISGMTLDDFIRSVYLHQEAIRALLTDGKDERDEALDRLFGLDKMRNIVKAIPIKDVKDKIGKLQDRKEKLGQKITGAIEQVDADIEKFKRKASENGLSEKDLNLDYARENARQIIQEIESLSKDLSVPKTEIDKPTNVSEFSGFESKVKKILKEMQSKNVDHDKMSKLNSRKIELENLSDAVTKQEVPITELQNEINVIVSKEGDLVQIGNKISSVENELTKESDRRDSLDANSKLINDAIQALATLTKPECPVCDNPIDIQKTIKKLEKQSQSIVADQIKEIDKKVFELKDRKASLEDLKSRLSSYSKRLDDERSIEDEALSKLSTEFGQEKKDREKLLSSTRDKIREYDDEIKTLGQSSKEQTDRLQTIRDSLDLIGIIIDVLNKENELGTLNNLNPEDSQEIDNIGKAVEGLRRFEDKLSKIVNAAGKIQTELASEMISASEKDIENFYTNLCKHQHYDKLKIDVKPQEIKGRVKNAYAIRAFSSKDGKETHVATRFSTGQMNCVALSVFFALTKDLPVKLGFLVLDDPSQNLDSEHKSALADILASISNERQIFISTQDEEFKDILQSKQKDMELHEFVGWNASGPKFN